MRRADREVREFSQIVSIMERCDICYLALNDADGFPYVIPMNFALEALTDRVVLYLHCAREGKKLDLIRRDPRCAFSMDCNHVLELGSAPCAATWKYESVCGRGRLSEIGGEEGIRSLRLLMKHYDPDREHEFDERHLKAVTLLRMDVEELTGKRRDRK